MMVVGIVVAVVVVMTSTQKLMAKMNFELFQLVQVVAMMLVL